MIKNNPVRILWLLPLFAAVLMASCKDKIDKSLTRFPEWPEVLTPTIDGVQIGVSSIDGFIELTLNLTQGQELELTGIESAEKAIDRTWFEFVSDSKIKFLGPAGQYLVLYSNELKVLLVQPKSSEGLEYPDALWMMGDKMAFAQPPFKACTGWGWAPVQAFFCRKTGNTAFETVIYLHNGFKIKYFKDKTWNTGSNSQDMTWTPTDFFANGWYDNGQGGGHYTGDIVPGSSFVPGVYRIVADIAANTLTATPVQ